MRGRLSFSHVRKWHCVRTKQQSSDTQAARSADLPRHTTFDFAAASLLPAANSISGLVVEYIVAIDVTRVRFPADACMAG